MGFFDKIKQATQFVTGGGASLQIQQVSNDASDGQALQFVVLCQVKADMDIRGVYVEIAAEERVEVEDFDYTDQSGSVRRELIYRETETYRSKTIVIGAQSLAANTNYEWPVSISIPSNVNGTYRGVRASHVWAVLAGIDKAGNDPDSGWTEIEVYN